MYLIKQNSTLNTKRRKSQKGKSGMVSCQRLLQWATKFDCSNTTVYFPSSELGLPHPISRMRVCPPEPVEWGGYTLACMGGGMSQFGRLKKKLSTLSTLCYRVQFTVYSIDWQSTVACTPSASHQTIQCQTPLPAPVSWFLWLLAFELASTSLKGQ
jgi:hypothetical protein